MRAQYECKRIAPRSFYQQRKSNSTNPIYHNFEFQEFSTL